MNGVLGLSGGEVTLRGGSGMHWPIGKSKIIICIILIKIKHVTNNNNYGSLKSTDSVTPRLGSTAPAPPRQAPLMGPHMLGPGSPPALPLPPKHPCAVELLQGLPRALAPRPGATGLPAGLHRVASSRGTLRQLWACGWGDTLSRDWIFQSQQRVWEVRVGSLASVWGTCWVGVPHARFSCELFP